LSPLLALGLSLCHLTALTPCHLDRCLVLAVKISSISAEMQVVCWFNSGAFHVFCHGEMSLQNSSRLLALLIEQTVMGLIFPNPGWHGHKHGHMWLCVCGLLACAAGRIEMLLSPEPLERLWPMHLVTNDRNCVFSEMSHSRMQTHKVDRSFLWERRVQDVWFSQCKLAQFQLKCKWSAGSIPGPLTFC